MAMITV